MHSMLMKTVIYRFRRTAAEQLQLNFDAAQALHNVVAQFQALHTFLDVNNVGYVDATMWAGLTASANAEDVLKTRGVASEGTVSEDLSCCVMCRYQDSEGFRAQTSWLAMIRFL